MSYDIIKQWKTESGLEATILLVANGSHYCGYVKIEPGTHYFGRGYDDYDLEVHGGVTFAESPYWLSEEHKDEHWFGFDCSHSGDLSGSRTRTKFGVWRSLDYVTKECESLANQIKNFEEVAKL